MAKFNRYLFEQFLAKTTLLEEDDEVENSSTNKTPDQQAAEKKFGVNRKKNIIDTESYHKAFDHLFDSSIMALFDEKGRLKNKGTGGVIKNLGEDHPAVKLLGILGGMQFGAKSYMFKFLDDIEAAKKQQAEEDAKRRQAAEDKKARHAAANQLVDSINKTLRDNFNFALLDKVEQVVGKGVIEKYGLGCPGFDVTGEHKWNPEISEYDFPEYTYTIHKLDRMLSYVKFNTRYLKQKIDVVEYDPKTQTPTPEQIIKDTENYYNELLNELETRQAKWPGYAGVYNGIMSGGQEGMFVFQDADGYVYKENISSGLSLDTFMKEMDEAEIPLDSELVGYLYISDNTNHRTTSDSYTHYYVSVSDKANNVSLRNLGISKLNTASDLAWGKVSNGEETHPSLNDTNTLYIVPGMNRGYTKTVTHYATD